MIFCPSLARTQFPHWTNVLFKNLTIYINIRLNIMQSKRFCAEWESGSSHSRIWMCHCVSSGESDLLLFSSVISIQFANFSDRRKRASFNAADIVGGCGAATAAVIVGRARARTFLCMCVNGLCECAFKMSWKPLFFYLSLL